MQIKNNTIVTVLLLMAIVILGYVVFIKKNTGVENPPALEVATNSEPIIVSEEKPKSTIDPIIPLLQGFINNQNAYLIKECNVNGQRIFVNDSQAHDGPATFYDENGNQLESCGGFTIIPTPEDSMCRTVLPYCTIVFNSMGGTISVDTYHLK